MSPLFLLKLWRTKLWLLVSVVGADPGEPSWGARPESRAHTLTWLAASPGQAEREKEEEGASPVS